MKIRSFIAVLVAWAFASAALANSVSPSACCMGGGPTPVTKVHPVRHLVLDDEAQEFLILEKSQEVLYRTVDDELRWNSLTGGKSTKITDLDQALSRVTDKDTRFLITEPHGEFWDLAHSKVWRPVSTNPAPVQPIFWEGKTLYYFQSEEGLRGAEYLQLFQYTVGEKVSIRGHARVAVGSSAYRLARGHQFPHVYFYRVHRGFRGFLFSLHRLDVRTGILSHLISYNRQIPEELAWVHWFEGKKSVAMLLQGGPRPLLYNRGLAGCRYQETAGEQVLVPHPNVPILVLLNKNHEVSVLDLEERRRTDLVQPGTRYKGLRPSDLYLTLDGRQLFLNPAHGSARSLYQLTIKNP